MAHWAHEIEEMLGWRKVFIVSAALPIIGLFGMGLFGGWLSIAFTLGLIICRGLSTVVFYDALNKRVDGEFRATVNSLGTRGLFIVTGPLLGYLVDTKGVNSTLLILAVVLLPVVLAVLYYLSINVKKESRQNEVERQAATGISETLTA